MNDEQSVISEKHQDFENVQNTEEDSGTRENLKGTKIFKMPVSNAISKFEIGNLFTQYINTQTNSYIINPNGQFNLACKHTKTQ